MTDTDFHARRTELANAFAAAGANLLEFMGSASALAAIPDSVRFVAAGCPAAIRAQLDTINPQRRMRHGDRPEQPLYFGPETGQPRRWAALITSAGHGVLQEYGSAFEHAQPGQEVLEVMEIVPGTPAIANKAAEEGDRERFEAWYFPKFGPQKMLGDSDQYHTPSTQGAWQAWQAAIAADRASRQVADKAEVDLSNLTRYEELDNGVGGVAPHAKGRFVKIKAVEKLLATHPATTGASTAPATIVVKAGNAFIATPGTKVIHEEDQVGASTVLTDERIKALFLENGFTVKDGLADLKPYVYAAARAIEREVAAQAGQVAVPEGWKLVPIEPTLDMVTQGFESAPDEFFSPGEDWDAYAAMTGCQKAAHRAKLCYAAMLAAAPSAPAVAQQAPAQAKPLPELARYSIDWRGLPQEDANGEWIAHADYAAQASTAGGSQEGGAA